MEEAFVLVLLVVVASFVVVPFLGWGLSDPAGQWSSVQEWRHGRSEDRPDLADTAHGKQRVLNGVGLVLWLALAVVAFRTLG